ncbi:sarcosine oxidase subunit gamma [Methylophaga sp. OBS4]|uniref:sarcosine oxidase subunit gamma n=1 Tax=Methylophaga sp. OBS4 TaxID=2991935 RepID=UPI002253424A|nr:sarcosine oxidase subunit gamma [Methylophaga sp. OBS4]MCX4187099.1 sarcosine oxidase subunit gamma [Methylophaga sp. OBS4]
MQDAVYRSPVAFAQSLRKPVVGDINGMSTALSFAETTVEDAHSQTLSICDVSALNRFGVKGPNASAWLTAANVNLPTGTNSWTTQDDNTLVMRLGNTEFLLEDQPGTELCSKLNQTSVNESGIHKVSRNDAAFILSGELIQPLFSEVCAIDLNGDVLDDNRLVMTMIAGVSATLLRQSLNGQTVYRLWCDGTFGPYLWKTLLNIIKELGGGPVGINRYFKSN